MFWSEVGHVPYLVVYYDPTIIWIIVLQDILRRHEFRKLHRNESNKCTRGELILLLIKRRAQWASSTLNVFNSEINRRRKFMAWPTPASSLIAVVFVITGYFQN